MGRVITLLLASSWLCCLVDSVPTSYPTSSGSIPATGTPYSGFVLQTSYSTSNCSGSVKSIYYQEIDHYPGGLCPCYSTSSDSSSYGQIALLQVNPMGNLFALNEYAYSDANCQSNKFFSSSQTFTNGQCFLSSQDGTSYKYVVSQTYPAFAVGGLVQYVDLTSAGCGQSQSTYLDFATLWPAGACLQDVSNAPDTRQYCQVGGNFYTSISYIPNYACNSPPQIEQQSAIEVCASYNGGTRYLSQVCTASSTPPPISPSQSSSSSSSASGGIIAAVVINIVVAIVIIVLRCCCCRRRWNQEGEQGVGGTGVAVVVDEAEARRQAWRNLEMQQDRERQMQRGNEQQVELGGGGYGGYPEAVANPIYYGDTKTPMAHVVVVGTVASDPDPIPPSSVETLRR